MLLSKHNKYSHFWMTTNQTASPQPMSRAQWGIEVDRAILKGDEASLWQVLARAPDQDSAMQEIADRIPRLIYNHRGQVHLSELFLAPVLATGDAAQLFDDKGAWRSAANCIDDTCRSWFGRTPARLKLFPYVRPYDWLGTWRPSVLRSHLLATVPGQKLPAADFLTEVIELPKDAPRLGFLALVATTRDAWLKLPHVDAGHDARFKLVVSSALQAQAEHPVTTLTPERVQYAVTDGLCHWLAALHEVVPIQGWMVALQPTTPDVVRVTLSLADDAVPLTQFTMRKHQLGTFGIAEVIEKLASLAQMLDEPMDTTPRAQRVVLDLT